LQHPPFELGIAPGADDYLDPCPTDLDPDMSYDGVVGGVQAVCDA